MHIYVYICVYGAMMSNIKNCHYGNSASLNLYILNVVKIFYLSKILCKLDQFLMKVTLLTGIQYQQAFSLS